MLLVLSFPLQVISSNPVPSLFPYLWIAFVLSLTLRFGAPRLGGRTRRNSRTPMDVLVNVYLVLVFFQTGWQTALGFISTVQGLSAIFIYALPAIFYLYFRGTATDQESRTILMAIALVGFGVGIYFVYDSYSMFIKGQVNDFSRKAFEYAQSRGEGNETNEARISAGYRSHGPLESSYVSAAWVALGCFAALTLIPSGATLKRIVAISSYGLILLAALNFTSLVGFGVVIVLMEFRAIALLRGRVSLRGIKSLAEIAAGFVLLGALLFGTIGDEMFGGIQKSLGEQVGVLMGTGIHAQTDETYVGRLIGRIASFPEEMLEYPPGFIIGEGFSIFGGPKGGDIGIADTLRRFGLPFFIAIIVGLFTLVLRAERQISGTPGGQTIGARCLWFAVCATIYLLFTEVHYSVWNTKSILPIFFLSLAFYRRYLLRKSSAGAEFVKSPVSVT